MQVLWMLTADDGTPVRAELTRRFDDVEFVIRYGQTVREFHRFPSDLSAVQYAEERRQELHGRGYVDRPRSPATNADAGLIAQRRRASE